MEDDDLEARWNIDGIPAAIIIFFIVMPWLVGIVTIAKWLYEGLK
jgi:hypothetical protein